MHPYAWYLLPCLSAAADTGRRLGYAMDDSTIRTAVAAWLSNPTAAAATYGHISTWETGGVTDMSHLFCGLYGNSDCNTAASSFNDDIGAWDTSGVIRMDWMFHRTYFNQDIGAWDTSGVVSMHGMFAGAFAFNQDIGGWAVHSVTTMYGMFSGAWAFNQTLGWCLDHEVDLDLLFWNTPCSSTSCGIGRFGHPKCPDYDGDGILDAAPKGECCVYAYDQPFTDACGTTLTEVEASGCCPDDFLLRYSHDIFKLMLTDYTRWDCVSFVDKEACDLKGPPYTWGSCWHSAYDQAAATCKTCTEDDGFDVRACSGLFLQEAKGKWNDWYHDPGWNQFLPPCHQHSCCALNRNHCCETNAAAVAGAVVVCFAVLAGLIILYYKCCRKPAIAEPSTPPPKAQPEATSPKEEEAIAVAPEAEESPQETLAEAPPPAPPARGWFGRAEPVPEPEGEAEETLAEDPPPPPAKGWFAEPEGEAESAPFAEQPSPPGSWFSRAAPEPSMGCQKCHWCAFAGTGH